MQKLFTVVRTPAVISRIALASSSQFAVACSMFMPICGTSIVFSFMRKTLPILPAQQDMVGQVVHVAPRFLQRQQFVV